MTVTNNYVLTTILRSSAVMRLDRAASSRSRSDAFGQSLKLTRVTPIRR